MSDSVLLLSPSRGLGGGIERFVATVEAAFTQHAVRYRRLDLLEPGEGTGARVKLRFVGEVTRAARAGRVPVRLVLAHRNLLPVIYPVAMLTDFLGATVILHGREIWSGRQPWGHRALRRPDVQVLVGVHAADDDAGRGCDAGHVGLLGLRGRWGSAHRSPRLADKTVMGRLWPGSPQVTVGEAKRLAGMLPNDRQIAGKDSRSSIRVRVRKLRSIPAPDSSWYVYHCVGQDVREHPAPTYSLSEWKIQPGRGGAV